MKKILAILSILFFVVFTTLPLMAETRGPGDPGNDPELGGDPPLGGGAPIGGGTFILMGLGAAYAGKKIYELNKNEKENTNN
jgi:hypothetical protein